MKCFCGPASGTTSLLPRKAKVLAEPAQMAGFGHFARNGTAQSNVGTLAISRLCMCREISPMLTILTPHWSDLIWSIDPIRTSLITFELWVILNHVMFKSADPKYDKHTKILTHKIMISISYQWYPGSNGLVSVEWKKSPIDHTSQHSHTKGCLVPPVHMAPKLPGHLEQQVVVVFGKSRNYCGFKSLVLSVYGCMAHPGPFWTQWNKHATPTMVHPKVWEERFS